MTRRLVVHVGLPKCGSTTLQDALQLARPDLSAANISVERLKPMKYVQRLAAGDNPKLWRQLSLRNDSKTVIYSAEFLCCLDATAIDTFMSNASANFDEATVVFILRPIKDWLRSRMVQRGQGLPQAHQEMGLAPIDFEVDSPDLWLKQWSHWVYQKPKVRRLLLLPLIGQQPLPQRFLNEIGFPDVVLPTQALAMWSNERTDPRGLELIRVFNELAAVTTKRLEIESLRNDKEIFSLIKEGMTLAKNWTTSQARDDSTTTPAEIDALVNQIHDGIMQIEPEPLRTKILYLMGMN